MNQPFPRREGMSIEVKHAIFGAMGCLGFLCLLCVGLVVVAAVPDVIGLSLSVTAAFVPAMVFVLAVIWLDRYEREPFSVLAGTFFWGSVVAIALALIVELLGSLVVSAVVGADAADLLNAVIGAPVIEEAAKGLVLLLLFFLVKNEFDDTLDGIVYGSVVGLGFAMTENILYLGQQYMEGGVGAFAELFVVRVLLSGLGHALYTGTTGAGLGFARETTNTFLKVVVPIGAFILGVGQHLLWNGSLQALGTFLPEPQSFLEIVLLVASMSLVLSGPVLVVLLTIVVLTWRRERRVIAQFLASEVEANVVTEADYAALSSSWRRNGTLYRGLLARGVTYWYHLRRLYRTETELAFSKWHASLSERQGRPVSPARADHYRTKIEAIRAKLGTL